MEVQPDFKELLALLNEHKVEYIIVGGYALAFHGAPRYTADLDILVKAGKQNAEHILSALDNFGFAHLDLKPVVVGWGLPHQNQGRLGHAHQTRPNQRLHSRYPYSCYS